MSGLRWTYFWYRLKHAKTWDDSCGFPGQGYGLSHLVVACAHPTVARQGHFPPKKAQGTIGGSPAAEGSWCVCVCESICMNLPTSNMAMENRWTCENHWLFFHCYVWLPEGITTSRRDVEWWQTKYSQSSPNGHMITAMFRGRLVSWRQSTLINVWKGIDTAPSKVIWTGFPLKVPLGTRWNSVQWGRTISPISTLQQLGNNVTIDDD